MSGWTRYDSSWKWSDWGSWSGWSTNYVSSNDSTQVETRTGYHYYYYVCSNCGDICTAMADATLGLVAVGAALSTVVPTTL